MNWTQLLKSDVARAYSSTAALIAKVDDDALDWKPATGNNWMTTAQLLKHLSCACGAPCQAFLSGDWGPPPPEELPRVENTAEALRLLEEDKALALHSIKSATEDELALRTVAAPWAPDVHRVLAWHFLQMVRHLESHKSQLFYYLKLQGKDVGTADLWN